jgi:glycosyltransferase involved in cell wall biosynthesis
VTPEISVLVPSYNYASKIGGCIESVLAQTHGAFELVVSDDASTDGSDAVIRRYTGDPRLVYERQPKNLGMVPNWRRCVELARGEYLLLLGADDELRPAMLQRCAAVLDGDREVAFCHTAADFIDDRGRIVGTTGAFQRSFVRPGVDLVDGFLRGRRVVNSSALFRRSAYDALGGWSPDYRNCMDADLWFRMMLRYRVGYVGSILVRFRSHRVSAAWTLLQAEEDLRFLRSMFERLPPSLEPLRRLEPGLVRALAADKVNVLQALPPGDERDRLLATVRALSGDGTTPAPPVRSGAAALLRARARARATIWLARLPGPLRYRVGEWMR